MVQYFKRLIDSTDRGADSLSVGVLLGFFGFQCVFIYFGIVFMGNAFFPTHVQFDAGKFAAAVLSLAGSYSTVLAATTTAYHWRSRDDDDCKPPESPVAR